MRPMRIRKRETPVDYWFKDTPLGDGKNATRHDVAVPVNKSGMVRLPRHTLERILSEAGYEPLGRA